MQLLRYCFLGIYLFNADAKLLRNYGQALLRVPDEVKSNLLSLEARISGEDKTQYSKNAIEEEPEPQDPNHIGFDKIQNYQSTWCPWILCALFMVCCCTPAIGRMIGPDNAVTLCSFVTTVMLVFLVLTGLYNAWWNGKIPHSSPCGVLCVAAFLLAVIGCGFCACICCCGLAILPGSWWIKNQIIKKMHNLFNEREPTLPGPRREYYKSECFRTTCENRFIAADKDGNGVLDMKELEEVVIMVFGEGIRENPLLGEAIPVFMQCFDDNKNSKVEREEFTELMKLFSVMTLREDGRSQALPGLPEEQSLRQYFEILQLQPTATVNETEKAFRKMSQRWHPDKAQFFSTTKEQATADFQELSEAKDKVEEYLRKREGTSVNKDPQV